MKTTERKREKQPEAIIPYVRHVNKHVIALESRALMTVVKLEGINFETADIIDLNVLHEQLNNLFKNIADERIALYSHIIRKRETVYPDGAFRSAFAKQLDDKYRERMVSQELYRNDLYLSILWNPHVDKTDKLAEFFKRLGKAKQEKTEVDAESVRKLEDITTDLIQNLERYGAKRLSLYEHEGNTYSQQSEFIHQLVGGRRERIPLTWGTIASTVYSDRLIFGKEIIEIRTEAGRRFAGMFGWKEYPAKTRVGMADGLLTLPFEFIFTQSFVFKSKNIAKQIMGRKQNQMVNAGDRAGSKIMELDDALDDLESNRFVLGEHHLSLAVFADTPQELADNLAKARSRLTDGGAVIDDEIAILSGTTKNIELLETIMDEVGESPEKWLPLFQERSKQ